MIVIIKTIHKAKNHKVNLMEKAIIIEITITNKIVTIRFNLMKMMTLIMIRGGGGQRGQKTKKHSLRKLFRTIRLWCSLKWRFLAKLKEARADQKALRISPNRWGWKTGIQSSFSKDRVPNSVNGAKAVPKEVRTK